MAQQSVGEWPYNAGERGRNWVRAFEQRGRLYLEWREPVIDPETGAALVDPVTGKKKWKRPRVVLDTLDREDAKLRADKLAAEFRELDIGRTAPTTVAQLIARYLGEVTPGKGGSKQGHDRTAARVWLRFFDMQPEKERRSARKPATLDRTDWDRFVATRRAGQITGFARVRNRQIQYDLKFMISVLNWATGTGVNGRMFLDRNPWNADVRRTQKWGMPKELNPDRPEMTDGLRELLIANASSWQFSTALILERETRRRNNAIRQLYWTDIDLEGETIVWREETDKGRRSNVTPISARAVAALKKIPRGIGRTPVFPMKNDPSQPTPRHTFNQWLKRAKAKLLRSIEDEAARDKMRQQLRRVGFHAEKRAGVRDPKFRELPPQIQEEISGTSFETLRKVYDQVTVGDMREAMQRSGT